MATKPIKSTNPIKQKVVKTFKDKFGATKITSVVFDNKSKIYYANCFRKFMWLGGQQVNESEIEERA
jgi:hypothetical protein